MKKLSVVCALLLSLLVSPCFAIEYCTDFLEQNNPGGWSESLKTFEDEWTMGYGDEITVDIWINDLSEGLLTAGFYFTYDPSLVSVESVVVYDDRSGSDDPWDPEFTFVEPAEESSYVVAVGNFAGVTPDADGDIIIAKITFRCQALGEADIMINTIPDFITVVGYDTHIDYDSQISPKTVTMHQLPATDCCLNINPTQAEVLPQTQIQFSATGTQECNPPDLVWSDNCVNGDVDPATGLFTADSIEDLEYCSVCVIDTANPNPCSNPSCSPPADCCADITVGIDYCEGDFDLDGDQDGSDAVLFKTDFGRSPHSRPCPSTTTTTIETTTTTTCDITTTTTTIEPPNGLLPDALGDNIGAVDLIGAQAELYDRGDQTLLKLTIESTPHLPGVVVFEADVDDSTETGGSMSWLGAPVAPCPCKITAGTDIVIVLFTRGQADNSAGAFCSSCTDDNLESCAAGRRSGEWYADTSINAKVYRRLGILRGLLDPLPKQPSFGQTEDSYTLPWEQILAYAYSELVGDPRCFDYERARDPSNNKWQVSIWYDNNYAADEDDMVNGTFPLFTFDISDWAPNGDGNKADMQILTGSHNLCY